jgi:hypothetical protein
VDSVEFFKTRVGVDEGEKLGQCFHPVSSTSSSTPRPYGCSTSSSPTISNQFYPSLAWDEHNLFLVHWFYVLSKVFVVKLKEP